MEIKLDINGIVAEGKSLIEKYKETKTYNKESYDKLLEKYTKAIETVELLNMELERLKSEELTPEKIKTFSSAIELLGQLTPDKMANLEDMQKKFGGKS